jgi:hypothetical protein
MQIVLNNTQLLVPNEIFVHIFERLPVAGLEKIRTVCKHFQLLTENRSLWKAVFHNPLIQRLSKDTSLTVVRRVFWHYVGAHSSSSNLTSLSINDHNLIATFNNSLLRLWNPPPKLSKKNSINIIPANFSDKPNQEWTCVAIDLKKKHISTYLGNHTGSIYVSHTEINAKPPTSKLKILTTKNHNSAVTTLKIGEISSYSGDNEGRVKKWRTSSGQLQKEWCPHNAPVTGLAYCHLDRNSTKPGIFSCSLDGTIAITNTKVPTILSSHKVPLVAITAYRTRLLFSCGIDGTIGIWENHKKHRLNFTLHSIVSLPSDGPPMGYPTAIRYIPASILKDTLSQFPGNEKMSGVILIGTNWGQMCAYGIEKNKKYKKSITQLHLLPLIPPESPQMSPTGPILAIDYSTPKQQHSKLNVAQKYPSTRNNPHQAIFENADTIFTDNPHFPIYVQNASNVEIWNL